MSALKGILILIVLINPSACMRERVTAVTVSVSVCVTVLFQRRRRSGLKLTSVQSDNLSPLNASGTSAVTAVIYAGTAQSLNGLACELLVRGTLYHSCKLTAIGFLSGQILS